MTTLTIKIPDRIEKSLTDIIEQLGGEILVADKEKKSAKATKKQQILDDLEESVKSVKLHQEGKVKAKTIQELLDEL